MIDIEEVVGTKVKVKGLSNDYILVIEGMKKLKIVIRYSSKNRKETKDEGDYLQSN